jgi:hypothetical protein
MLIAIAVEFDADLNTPPRASRVDLVLADRQEAPEEWDVAQVDTDIRL